MKINYTSHLECDMTTHHPAWRSVDGMDELVKLPGYSLLTTLNGSQWSGTSTMTMDELQVLHAYLGDYIREHA